LTPVGALLLITVILSAVAVVLCLVILYRSARTPSALSPLLEQRLLGIEGTIGRSDIGRPYDAPARESRPRCRG
jgi:hypothetical protein